MKVHLKDERGYIVVETVGAFIPFLLLVISILSLVNIVAVQARVHYALTQAANTLSMYSYTLEVLGIANDLTALDNKAYKTGLEANALRDDINGILKGLDEMSFDAIADHGIDAADRVMDFVDEAVGDPQETLSMLMNFGVNELRNQLFEVIARPLVGRYLSNGIMSGSDYLLWAGVCKTKTGGRSGELDKAGLAALDFFRFSNLGIGDSVMIDRNGNVKLTVDYEILYTFFGLKLPFKPTIRITQTVVTKAWLNGSGKGYW